MKRTGWLVTIAGVLIPVGMAVSVVNGDDRKIAEATQEQQGFQAAIQKHDFRSGMTRNQVTQSLGNDPIQIAGQVSKHDLKHLQHTHFLYKAPESQKDLDFYKYVLICFDGDKVVGHAFISKKPNLTYMKSVANMKVAESLVVFD